LFRGLTLQGQLYKMSVKDVALLYEYWTFLKLEQILGQKYETVTQDVVKVNLDGFLINQGRRKESFATLKRMRKSRFIFRRMIGHCQRSIRSRIRC
jgi:predicted component of viral defense system (DUF524 family)